MRSAIALMIMLFAVVCPGGCATVSERPEIAYTTLPTREVHVTFPAEFEQVHSTCQEVLRERLGYSSVSSTKDDKTGEGRIEAQHADGSSVRFQTVRSRDLASTSVTVLAADAGSNRASENRALEALKLVEKVLWPGGAEVSSAP
jgi:hypothetical protein